MNHSQMINSWTHHHHQPTIPQTLTSPSTVELQPSMYLSNQSPMRNPAWVPRPYEPAVSTYAKPWFDQNTSRVCSDMSFPKLASFTIDGEIHVTYVCPNPSTEELREYQQHTTCSPFMTQVTNEVFPNQDLMSHHIVQPYQGKAFQHTDRIELDPSQSQSRCPPLSYWALPPPPVTDPRVIVQCLLNQSSSSSN